MRQRDSVKTIVGQRLREAEGEYVSGEELSLEIGVTRNAIWKGVQMLIEEGYPIETRRRSGYRIIWDWDMLTTRDLEKNIRTKTLGSQIHFIPQTTSTNDMLSRLAEEGAPHGTVVVTNSQTQGKGRMGRRFESPLGGGVYFSVLLRENLTMEDSTVLTCAAAVAAARAVEQLCPAQVQIKWVNDLYLSGRKFCGILTEGRIHAETASLESVIIGFGFNIRNAKKLLSPELQMTATALEDEVPGAQVNRNVLVGKVLEELEQVLPGIPERRFLADYRSRSWLIGKIVYFDTPEGERKARVLDVNNDCGLIVRNAAGEVSVLHAGEVRLMRKHIML